MRTARLFVPIVLLFTASPAFAQNAYFGGSFIVAEPQQDFRQYVNTSYGGSVNFLWTPQPRGSFGIRAEGGMIGYGNEHRHVRLSRVQLDQNTSNFIAFLHAGPQLTLRAGVAQPYVSPSAGFTYIATVTSLSGDDNSESFASDTHYKDFLFSYGATAGLLIPVARGRTPVALDLSARYYQNGKASYLVEGSIEDNPDGSITYDPIRSDANLLTFQIGVSIGIVDRKQKGSENHD